MKSLQALLLLIVLFIATCGTYISFYIQQYNIQTEVRAAIKAQKKLKSEKFHFTQNEFSELKKYEGEREFSMNGIIYDVVKKIDVNGTVVLHAYADHKETSLLENFSSFFQEEHDSENATHKVKPVFSAFDYLANATIQIYHPPVTAQRLYNEDWILCRALYLPSTPPPDSLV